MVLSPIIKKSLKPNEFHGRYLELCKVNNVPPINDVKNKNKKILEFYGDRFKLNDWILIIKSLKYDQTLECISIKLRKSVTEVLDFFDTEKKLRSSNETQLHPIATKFILLDLIDAIAKCLKNNKNLITLILEGLPLTEKYVTSISNGLTKSTTIQNLNLSRCQLGDEGCKIICSTVTYLSNIEHINFSQCSITSEGAKTIANLIKNQKINRYTEGWKQSLRYRNVTPDKIPGLNKITLNNNQLIKDEGLEYITEILKEDLWIKIVNMENCGITDQGAKAIIDCCNINKTINQFNIKQNLSISNDFNVKIHERFGYDNSELNREKDFPKIKKKLLKTNMNALMTMKQQLTTEIFRRENTESLNQELKKQLLHCQHMLNTNSINIPDGFTLIETGTLEGLIKERDDFKKTQNTQSVMKLLPIRANKKRYLPKKAKSEITSKHVNNKKSNVTKSESGINKEDKKNEKRIYIERNIGDSTRNNQEEEEGEENQFIGMDALKLFLDKQSNNWNSNNNTTESSRNINDTNRKMNSPANQQQLIQQLFF